METIQELESIAKDLDNLYAEKQAIKLNEVKVILKEKVIKLKSLENEIAMKENALKELKNFASELEDEIRKAWQPFVAGADQCSLDIDGIKISMNKTLNVKVDDIDITTDWLLNNGYKDVLKYQIHNQTLKKIARELKKDNENPTEIPGLTYSEFYVLNV